MGLGVQARGAGAGTWKAKARRQACQKQQGHGAYLLQSLIVDEARRILGHLELALLDVLTKLPTQASAETLVPDLAW